MWSTVGLAEPQRLYLESTRNLQCLRLRGVGRVPEAVHRMKDSSPGGKPPNMRFHTLFSCTGWNPTSPFWLPHGLNVLYLYIHTYMYICMYVRTSPCFTSMCSIPVDPGTKHSSYFNLILHEVCNHRCVFIHPARKSQYHGIL